MNSERLEQLKVMLQEKPGDSFLMYAIAQELSKGKNKQEALKFYTDLVQDNPDYTGVYYHLGKLYETLGHIDKAIVTYKQGLQVTQRLGARHDHSELMGALNLIDDEEDDEY